MPNPFDAKLEELKERGLDAEDVDELRELMAASPIRKERDDALAKLRTYEGTVRKAAFKDAGVEIDPDLINPELLKDLDVSDVEKVKEWAIGRGLAKPKEPTEEERAEEQQLNDDLAASQRTAAAASNPDNGSATGVISPADTKGWSTEKLLRFKSKYPEQFELLKRGEQVSGVAFS